jgi:hypothetical protein
MPYRGAPKSDLPGIQNLADQVCRHDMALGLQPRPPAERG